MVVIQNNLRRFHDKGLDLYLAGLVLAFLLGMGVMNGVSTQAALAGQQRYLANDCHKKVTVATDRAEKKGIQTGVAIGYIAGQAIPH